MTNMTNVLVPISPAFLDPLITIDTCFYYAIPKFHSFHHPNTKWLITMMKCNAEDRIKRKMELKPDMFKSTYFQMIDFPKIYLPHETSVTPMFKRQSVLYMTPLGMALYLRSVPIVDLILLYRKREKDEAIGNPNEPQFASHVQDIQYGDFHAFPACVIMLRMYCFQSTVSLLNSGWNPTLPLTMPMRRRYERRAFYFFDWLELALGLLSERPLYPLQSLLLNMTRCMDLYKYLKLPKTSLLPPTPKDRILTGLIDIEDLPVGSKMIGVKSLLDVCQEYDSFMQMRSRAMEIQTFKREAAAAGYNLEILMMQATDYDGLEEAQSNESNARSIQPNYFQQLTNANNSATGGAKRKKEYAGEGCRVMYYAMEKDKASKRMQVCLDTLIIMIKRGFYYNKEPLSGTTPRARDLRNVVALLLNMIQREQAKLDTILTKINCGFKKFAHVETHKILENRRLACGFNISKMVSALARLLLQSKTIVAFLSAKFPPFSVDSTDFKISKDLEWKYNEIKGGIIQEFNSIKDAWTHLTKDMLQEVAKIKSFHLHFRVGKKPTSTELLRHKKIAMKHAKKKSRNQSNQKLTNTNSRFANLYKLQTAPSEQQLSSSALAGHWEKQTPCSLGTEIRATSESDLASVNVLPLTRSGFSATDKAILLMGDAVTEYNDDSLSETGLLMSSLCREMHQRLRPRCEKQGDSQ